MSDFPIPKKSEGWLGLLLTAILCLGFPYWWFRPARETWQPYTAAQLVAVRPPAGYLPGHGALLRSLNR